MKNILILGAHGFLGTNLSVLLKDYGNSKQLLANVFKYSRRNGLNLHDYNSTSNILALTRPDIIVNCAADVGNINYVSTHAADVMHNNSLMALNLYQCVKDFNSKTIIINPISNCSYPGEVDIQTESEWWNGEIHESILAYGFSKKVFFIASECYRKQYGINTINLIVPNAYGPNDHIDAGRTHAMNGLILRMIKAKHENLKQFTIWGTGTPIREWIYMPDTAEIIKQIIENEMFNIPNPLNLGKKEGISIKESAELIREKLQYDVEFVYDTTKQDGAPIKILDNTAFNKTFPNFKFTSYDVGIDNTIQNYVERMALNG